MSSPIHDVPCVAIPPAVYARLPFADVQLIDELAWRLPHEFGFVDLLERLNGGVFSSDQLVMGGTGALRDDVAWLLLVILGALDVVGLRPDQRRRWIVNVLETAGY